MSKKPRAPQKRKDPAEGEKPELIPQKHGGALYAGGVPGNRGGGRPPSAVRQLAREAFEARIPMLADLADDSQQRTRDRIRAIDVLGKYGLGQAKGLDENEFEEVVLRMAEAVQLRTRASSLPSSEADAFLEAVLSDWKEIIRAYRAGTL